MTASSALDLRGVRVASGQTQTPRFLTLVRGVCEVNGQAGAAKISLTGLSGV